MLRFWNGTKLWNKKHAQKRVKEKKNRCSNYNIWGITWFLFYIYIHNQTRSALNWLNTPTSLKQINIFKFRIVTHLFLSLQHISKKKIKVFISVLYWLAVVGGRLFISVAKHHFPFFTFENMFFVLIGFHCWFLIHALLFK